MKLLCRESRTRSELELWAGQKKLVFAQFFFWNAGSPLQKSLEGLYRMILWQVLRDSPSIIPELFPDIWRDLEHEVDIRFEPESFDMTDIIAAFERMTNSKNSFSNSRYCFLIDGLDEFDGDHWKICKSLHTWTSSGDVKICFSGRPYSEFEQLFPHNHLRFRLQELTAPDMAEFVRSELGGDERFTRVKDSDDRYSRLVDSIVTRADGVFLWVRLATRSILPDWETGTRLHNWKADWTRFQMALPPCFNLCWTLSIYPIVDELLRRSCFSATPSRQIPHICTTHLNNPRSFIPFWTTSSMIHRMARGCTMETLSIV